MDICGNYISGNNNTCGEVRGARRRLRAGRRAARCATQLNVSLAL